VRQLPLDAIPYEAWEPTKTTLHLWTQVVGKIALACSPRRSHWWNATLKPESHGLRTSLLSSAQTPFEIAFDFHEHVLTIATGAAHAPAVISLHDGLSVAEFYEAVTRALRSLGIDVRIWTKPYGIPIETHFEHDREHHTYDATAARRFWNVASWTASVFERFAERFVGKQGPVQLFWHSFDLALGRYSGRRAEGPGSSNAVEREAYSHEVIAFGFWPGDARTPAPTYYTYTAPEPAALTQNVLRPAAAQWAPSGSGHLGVLPYEAVRTSAQPEATLLDFLQSGYSAGANAAHWDVAALERS